MCSTNFCSDTYSSCQASVNQARSSPPPSMLVLQPTLSNIITCQDAYVNYSATYNIIPPMYMGCAWFMNFGDADPDKCSSCSPNHTLICGVWYDPIQGSFQQMAMIEGAYEFLMEAMIENAALSDNSSSDAYTYQTSTSIATFWYVSSEQYYGGFCFCTTSNCNPDFATCTQGMNIPSYLLTYNGSTSSMSSVSTGTSSSSNTVSSSSTRASTTRIGSTSSSSSSIITSLLSSTRTPITTSTAVSSSSVGTSNTSSNTVAYRSLGEKFFFFLNVFTLVYVFSLSLFQVSNATNLSQLQRLLSLSSAFGRFELKELSFYIFQK
ncbi:unnamed protein product [Adineta steineri]|uniref:Uncharacterized protein n=1 Tax=Adineta steineri TaxID=433720 RepID=A0A814BGN7_9BILA|nr:unnamed protein product [Adineta steineri]